MDVLQRRDGYNCDSVKEGVEMEKILLLREPKLISVRMPLMKIQSHGTIKFNPLGYVYHQWRIYE